MRFVVRTLVVLAFYFVANSHLCAQGVWTPLTNFNPYGGAGTMMLLTDGTVMVQGSFTTNVFSKLTPDSSGNYINGTWTTLAPMSTPRLYVGSAILPSGKLFVVGGEYSGTSGAQNFTNTGEIYDPITNKWSAITPFPKSQFGDDPVMLLNTGKILCGYIAGPQTYLYDPATNSWAQTGTKLSNDASDEETWLLLPNGNVLSYNVFASPATGAGSAQQYNPSTGLWTSTGTVPVPLSGSAFGFELGPGTRLPDGRYLQVGANNNTAIYTPSTNTWVAGPSLPAKMGADDAPGAMLPDGHFLFAADTSSPQIFTAPTRLYDFNYTTNTLTDVTPSGQLNGLLNAPAFIMRMLVLPNGHILLGSAFDSTVWDYAPSGSPLPAWQPTIASITNTGPNTYRLTGTQLTGISEGASYGDDAAMSTNYPIVKIKDATGKVFYARTSQWTPGVATGSTVTSVQFVTPTLTNGVYQLSVVANGISSASQTLVIGPPPIKSNVIATYAAATKTLTLTGDTLANSLTVSLQAGVLSVVGANGTTINNTTSFSTPFSGTLVVTANLNDGNDAISFIGIASSATNVTLGNGNDQAAFTLCNIGILTIDGGTGADTVLTTSSTITKLIQTNVP